MKFMDKCVEGDTKPDEIDGYVDSWHESDSDESIINYLGMTYNEYAAWIINPDIIADLIEDRKKALQ